MQWLNDPRVQKVVTFIVAFGIAYTPIASLIAAKVPRPQAGAPRWKRFLYDFLVDVPAWCAAVGRVGPFGGKASIPLVPSRLPVDNPPKNALPPPLPPPVAILLVSLFAFSGCYCWMSEHAQEPKCVIAHQVVDCTVASAKSAAGFLKPILQALFDAGKFDAQSAEEWAKTFGFRDLGCALAALENDFSTARGAGRQVNRTLEVAHITFTTWRDTYHPDVRFQIASGVLR